MNTGCRRRRRPRRSRERRAIMKINIVLSVLITFTISPMAYAVSPAPDGGYPGGNTARRTKALLSLTTGTDNTAVGWFSLKSNTRALLTRRSEPERFFERTADENTATGAGALFCNTTGFDNTAIGAFASFNNTDHSFNTATGVHALFTNTPVKTTRQLAYRRFFSTMETPRTTRHLITFRFRK